MSTFFNHNGKLLAPGQAIIDPSNRGFRYGEGIFETMKIMNGKICLEEFHFERLYAGMKLLDFDGGTRFTPGGLSRQILGLCKENNCLDYARVRLAVFRSSANAGESEDIMPDYVIECWPLVLSAYNEPADGLSIDIFLSGRKSMDQYSNLKSNNYLLYSMAARWAKARKLDDCLVLNGRGRVCDASIANVFAIKGNEVFTPALTEGGVAGTMRRYILGHVHKQEFRAEEIEMTTDWLRSVEEIFLTNAIRGIRPVKKFGDKVFPTKKTQLLVKWLNNIFNEPQLSIRGRV
ncbi:MAG: aminotransferase class IV [Chitinophagales bacterium]